MAWSWWSPGIAQQRDSGINQLRKCNYLLFIGPTAATTTWFINNLPLLLNLDFHNRTLTQLDFAHHAAFKQKPALLMKKMYLFISDLLKAF